MFKYFLVLLISLVSLSGFSMADSTVIPQQRFSPTQIANLKTSTGEYVKITYGQPFQKGRELFGNLVAYDVLWRLGANEATEITLTSDAEIFGNRLKAGTYTLFAIPHEKTWTLLFNSELGQWGAFKYNEAFDLLKVDIPVREEETIYEGLTIQVFEKATNAITVAFNWGKTIAELPIVLVKPLTTTDSSSSKKKRKKK